MSTTNKVLGNKYFISDMFFHKKSSLSGQMMSLSNKTFLIRTSYRTKDFYQQLLPFSFLNSFLSKNLGTNNVIFSNNLTKSFLNTTTRINAGTNSFFSFGKDNVTKVQEQNNILNKDFFQQVLIKTPSTEKLLTKVLATSGTNSFFLEEPSLFSVMSLSLEKNTSKNIQQQKPASFTRYIQTSSSYKQILTSLNKDILRTFRRKKRNLLYICTKTLPNFIPRHYGSSLSIIMGQLNRQNNLLS